MQTNTPKLLLFSTLFLLLTQVSFVSCAKDEAFIDLVGLEDPTSTDDDSTTDVDDSDDQTSEDTDGSQDNQGNQDTPPSVGSSFESSDGLKINETPCDFSLSDITSNTTLEINCQMDLGGQTVNLPAGVTLLYKEGEIINGTLNFSSSGVIDGNLLNIDLNIEGDVALLSNEFDFFAERWGIVERNNSYDVGFQNHQNIQEAVDLVKRLQGTLFNVHAMDAFFSSEKRSLPVVEMPSDFHFRMSDSTYMRIAHPDAKDYTSWMFRIERAHNVTISGGNLDGQRDGHGPGDNSANSLIWIKGGVDILVEGVSIKYATKTGLTINSYLFDTDPNYLASENVVVRNCLFDSNRANNLSITDGINIVVENCQLYRAGISTNVADGIAPMIGIVIEPVTGQKVDGVVIRNNILKEGAGKNSILAALGNDFLITGNEADKVVGWTSASNVRIINNPGLRGGVVAGFDSQYALSQSTGNEVSGNTILNADTGIRATNDDITISNNTIKDCTVGMFLTNLTNTSITNNTITSSVEGSFGINGRKSMKDIEISGNVVNLDHGRILSFLNVNSDPESQTNKVIFTGNEFSSSNNGVINDSYGIEIVDNDFGDGGIGFSNVVNLKFNQNNIYGRSSRCIALQKTVSTRNVEIMDNIVENTSSERLSAYGIKISSVGDSYSNEDTGVKVLRNEVRVKGNNYGIHSTSFNGVAISENKGWVEDNTFIYFRGNNSNISSNTLVQGSTGYDIQGSNNSVSNNN